MAWRPEDRLADYGPEYRANARICKQRANGRCSRCGKLSHQLQADHILPISQGGTHQLTNLQALCVHCHRTKTAREKKAPATDPQPRPTTQW